MTTPSLAKAKRVALKLRRWSNYTADWLDTGQGAVDYQQAHDCAQVVFTEAANLMEMCRRLGGLDVEAIPVPARGGQADRGQTRHAQSVQATAAGRHDREAPRLASGD